ncbi:MAG: hypothetical protein Q8N63_01965 [Nanoarchaeota archaeon]|nr:hypothetical protein [Nanoarchaeota archaeon]
MKKRTLIESGFAFCLFIFLTSFLAAAEYSNEVSNDFVISNEKASLVKSTEPIYNPNYLIGILIILILAIVILVFKKKKSKKNIKKR